jgi:exonuclease III
MEILLDQLSPDIVCVSEHWLTEEEIKRTSIANYALASVFTRSSGKGGGVAILSKSLISVSDIPQLTTLSIDRDFECAAIKWNLSTSTSVIVLSIYRSPCGNIKAFLHKLEHVLHEVSRLHGLTAKLIIGGDFNIDLLNCESTATQQFNDLINSYHLAAHIQTPTRITHTSRTTVDNIISNINSSLITYAKSIPLTISDHNGQIMCFSIANKKQANIPQPRRSFSQNQIKYFNELLEKTQWQDVYMAKTTEEKFECFHSSFMISFNRAFPKKTYQHQKPRKTGWITEEIREKSRALKDLHLQLQTSLNPEDKTNYNRKKRQNTKSNNEAKKSYNDKLISSAGNKSAGYWKVIKQNSESTPLVHTINLIEGSQRHNDPKICAEILNKHFHEVTLKLQAETGSRTIYACNLNPSRNNTKQFYLFPVSTSEIMQIIKMKCTKHSAGLDEVPSIILRHCAHLISTPLTEVINASFTEGIFPSTLKSSKIVPIHKKGPKTNPENYRPIALQSAFSKIFEVAICTRLVQFLEKQQLLSPSQHGFRKGRSTTTAIYTFIQATYEALDARLPVLGLFYDMSKAFDSMDHTTLKTSLGNMGIRGVTLSWMMSFLYQRKHCVEIQSLQGERITSELRTTNIGVPQGTVLGPLLYILYVNSLPAHLGEGIVTAYADDTNHLVTAEDNNALRKRANEAAFDMINWCDTAKLTVNTSKSQCLQFHLPHTIVDSSPLIKLGNNNIQTSSETKFLGLIINDTLNWTAHINNVMKKLASAPYLLRHLRRIANDSTVITAYYSYVHSHLAYGIMFWGASQKAMRVFKQQKRIVRALAGAPFRATCRPIFIKRKLLTLHGIFIYNTILYAMTHNTLTSAQCTEHINTRNKTHYVRPSHNLQIYGKSPLYQGQVLFNDLPQSMKDLQGTSRFKKELKIFLCNLCPYSIHDYHSHVVTLTKNSL